MRLPLRDASHEFIVIDGDKFKSMHMPEDRHLTAAFKMPLPSLQA